MRWAVIDLLETAKGQVNSLASVTPYLFGGGDLFVDEHNSDSHIPAAGKTVPL